MTAFKDVRMHDGSRHFASLPETYDVDHPQWHRLRAHVKTLPGAKLTCFLTDDITEAWIDFRYERHRFTMNNQCNEWWLFVTDPSCPDHVLEVIVAHLERYLGPRR